MNLKRLVKAFDLWRNGIPWANAYYFSNWTNPVLLNTYKNYLINTSHVTYNSTGQSVSKKALELFNSNFQLLEECFAQYELKETKQGLEVTWKGIENANIKILINDFSGFTVFKDVFVEEVYGFCIQEKCVVVDVGMNIGIASLYFASNPKVEKVIGYEPMPSTFSLAKLNINNNPVVSLKIFSHCIGWSDKSGFVQAPNSTLSPVFDSIKDKPIINEADCANLNEMLVVKDAAEIIEELLEQAGGIPIVVKLDCEGSEYSILHSLKQNHLLDKIKGFLIEWHEQGPLEINNILLENGYAIHYANNPHYPKAIGMIYAWR